MAHMSELGLFDYVTGKADLTSQEAEHLQDCDDCSNLALEMRGIIEDSGDIDKARILLAEEGTLPPAEQPKETHEDQRELDETPGSSRVA